MDDEYVDENIVEEDHDNDNEYENYEDSMQFQQQEQQEEIFIQPENGIFPIIKIGFIIDFFINF